MAKGAPPKKLRQLTAKQAAFVREYAVDSNATRAAIAAGFSAKSARDQGQQLLAKPHVRQALAERQASITERFDISADDVLRELAIIGLSSVEHYMLDEQYKVVVTADAPPHAIRAVRGVRYKIREQYADGAMVGKTYDVDFTLWNKNEALRDLGKYWRLFVDRLEVTEPLAEEARRLAEQYGLSFDELITEAQAMMAGNAKAPLRLIVGGT